MSEVKRIDEHVARLRGRLARGGMTYEGAVAVDELLSILTEIRWRLVDDLETGRTSAPWIAARHGVWTR